MTTAPVTETKRKRRRKQPMARRESRFGVALILPAVLVVALLVVFPLLWNVALSFQSARLIDIQDASIIGFEPTLKNYDTVIGARDFWSVLKTTFIYTIGGSILSILMGLWAALALQKAFRGRALVRGLVLFPYVVPVIAAAFVWQIMLNPQFGIVNEWLGRFGVPAIDFLRTRSYDLSVFGLFTFTIPLALVTVIVFEGWRYFPFAMLMILARLQAIDNTLYEAAEVDGASTWQKFWFVTLPELRYVLGAIFLLRLIWTFNKFDDIFLLTGGGFGTKVLPTLTYEFSFRLLDFGKGAAVGMILLAILIVFLIFYVGVVMRNVED